MSQDCLFCQIGADRILWSNDRVVVVADDFPVSQGHRLVLTRRHIGSFFEATEAERASISEALEAAKAQVEQDYRPDAYNIGINDGPAAGQTIPHLHVHLIPRYHGDSADPRGGVRWVRPETARYW